jgi:site-specific DNA recombinase
MILMKTAIYLRKSRLDEEKEKLLGQGETLAIHRKELLSIAKIKGLNVMKIHEELVSGESLLHRPAMLELLKEVEENSYDAVLVMDHQRLGRGDLEEQGIILKAFKKSNTKIITPDKTYDLNNEFDEEYSEFEAFMSRKEYKMINKRLQRGIIHSVKEGNYNGTYPPFGYDIAQDKKSRTLVPNAQAETVKMMFSWYAGENIGSQKIADRLNSMGIKTNRGNMWTAQAVGSIIKNPLYSGKITWRKAHGYYSSNKRKSHKKRPQEEWIIVDGKHDPIIDEETFMKANEYMKAHVKSPLKPKLSLNNALAGLVICGSCGGKLTYRTYLKSEPHLMCKNRCGNKSSKFKYVEKAVLDKLNQLLKDIKVNTAQNSQSKSSSIADALKVNILSLEKEMVELHKQKDNLHDLLERGVYTADVFIERSKAIALKMDSTEAALISTKSQLYEESIRDDTYKKIIPQLENAISSYPTLKTADEKNFLLKSILLSITYTKSKKQRNDEFEIDLNPLF